MKSAYAVPPLLWLVAAVAWIPTVGAGEIDARSWLSEMRSALGTIHYRGIVAYLTDGRIETMEIAHGVDNGVEQEDVRSLSGPRREVLRNKNEVVCYFPDLHSGHIERSSSHKSFFPTLPEDLESLKQIYSFVFTGEDRVANRTVKAISINPRDHYRYGRTLWLDRETKLPLKFELRGAGGEVVEQMVFTTVEVVAASLPLRDSNELTGLKGVSWKIDKPEVFEPERLDWTLTTSPVGFKLVSYIRTKGESSSDPVKVDHILLSDGLASVSIYAEPHENGHEVPLEKAMGAVSAYSKIVDGYMITVIGEVPKETVKLIAEGLQHTPDKR